VFASRVEIERVPGDAAYCLTFRRDLIVDEGEPVSEIVAVIVMTATALAKMAAELGSVIG